MNGQKFRRVAVTFVAAAALCSLSVATLAQPTARAYRIEHSINGKIVRTAADSLTLEEVFTLETATAKPATLRIGDDVQVRYRSEGARHVATKLETMTATGSEAPGELHMIGGRIVGMTSDGVTLETVFDMERDPTKPRSLNMGESVRVRYVVEGTRHIATLIERIATTT